jgi:hypothetical protein
LISGTFPDAKDDTIPTTNFSQLPIEEIDNVLCISISLGYDIGVREGSHDAEGLVDPSLRYNKTVTGFRYPRACRFRKYQFENRSWELPLPTFFKT